MLPELVVPLIIFKVIFSCIGNIYSQFAFELAVLSKLFLVKSRYAQPTKNTSAKKFGSSSVIEEKQGENLARYNRI